jgi:hypothetical protein
VQYQSIRPDPKRDADAAKLAADGATWPVYTLKRDHGAFEAGTVFYGVPSRSNPKHRWLANGVACRCPDYQQRGAMCAHLRAVRLHEAREQQEGSASSADPTPATRYDTLYPPCAAGCGDIVDRAGESCLGCGSERAYQQRIAAKIAAGVR